MKEKLFIVFAIFLAVLPVDAQKVADEYASTIKAKTLKEYVYILASDSCEGRNVGTEGIKKAQNYIVDQWKQTAGLQPYFKDNWLQSFPLVVYKTGESHLTTNNLVLKSFKDYMYSGAHDGFNKQLPIVFAGYGTEEDFQKIDAKGKAVFVLNNNLRTSFVNAKAAAKYGAELTLVANPENPVQFESIARQFEGHAKFNAYRPPFTDSIQKNILVRTHYRYLEVSPDAVKKLTSYRTGHWKNAVPGENDSIGTLKISLEQQQADTVMANNIVAFIPGTNGNESVIVGAHYDHLGVIDDEINYGADDNASGTAAVLALSRAFADAYRDGYRPAKNIIFIAFSAEEGGMYGSGYFAGQIENKNSVKLMVNIDMIGRADMEHADNQAYFYFIGENLPDSLYNQNDILCRKYKLTPDYSSAISSSDHKPFYEMGIPAVFYFDGINRDLHKPTDTPDKIDYNRMKKITRMIFETIWINAGIEKSSMNVTLN